ncbi:hypothetical protein E7V67_008550 [[Empedobacter] haloabium]|uniref:Uncharacterized protein n=1 Tax=[Empedobacter] haloabium TaxID=592317 RepID=A0ABZ1UQW2_9BURK
MKNILTYLRELLDHVSAQWAEDLRLVLCSAEATGTTVHAQHCTVQFALNQALRRLETSRALAKITFGIEGLIEELRHLDNDVTLDYYVISTPSHLGTCYVLSDRLLGCEFVMKSGTESRRGLWIDSKPIT